MQYDLLDARAAHFFLFHSVRTEGARIGEKANGSHVVETYRTRALHDLTLIYTRLAYPGSVIVRLFWYRQVVPEAGVQLCIATRRMARPSPRYHVCGCLIHARGALSLVRILTQSLGLIAPT